MHVWEKISQPRAIFLTKGKYNLLPEQKPHTSQREGCLLEVSKQNITSKNSKSNQNTPQK